MSEDRRETNEAILRERIWPRVKKTRGCWNWIGATGSSHGVPAYGCVWNPILKKKVSPHRFVYELCGGKIRPGFVVDHVCNNTKCVKPNHLRAVTQKENILRGSGPTAIHANKTHCLRGHLLKGKNVSYAYPPSGGYKRRRSCEACRRMRSLARKEKCSI